MATHSSILACEIPWTVEPDGLQSMASQRVGHNLLSSAQRNHDLMTIAAVGVNFSQLLPFRCQT